MEGATSVLMNVPYYLEFLIWRMRCGHGDGILEHNLFMSLRSVEMIAFLFILSILNIAVCMPLGWISGNCSHLSQHNFEVADIASGVGIIYNSLYDVLIEEEKLIGKYFMMGIFDRITNKLPPLQEYLDFMSEKKHGSLVGSRKEEDNVLPWDLLQSDFFNPTCKYIVGTSSFCIELICEATSIFRVEFRDERKVVAKYLSSFGGEKSM